MRIEAAMRELGRIGDLEAKQETAARRLAFAQTASAAQVAKAVEAEQVRSGAGQSEDDSGACRIESQQPVITLIDNESLFSIYVPRDQQLVLHSISDTF